MSQIHHKSVKSTNPADFPDNHLVIAIREARNVPSLDVGSASDPYVKLKIQNHRWFTTTLDNKNNPVWNESFDLGDQFKPEDQLRLVMYDKDPLSKEYIGCVEINLADLTKRPETTFILFDNDQNPILADDKCTCTELVVSIVKTPTAWAQPTPSPKALYPKHIMIISRGTRGDVQPYIALARGLAEHFGWLVTIVTEMSYKGFVKQNAKVDRGYISFRPCGGNTAVRIDTVLAKWAMQHKSEFLQTAMLARSEREFFSSEPPIFHWAKTLKPHALVYGFTMANIAMVISEALKIPMIGFILQPTVIPSSQYTAVIPISTHAVGWIDSAEEKFVQHDVQSKLKQFMENNPFSHALNTMRARRGLLPFTGSESETWATIISQNSPLVIPINAFSFGGKPSDWPENAVLTDFIFLRKGGEPPIAAPMMKFIDNAKAAKKPLLVMAFSSMPVERERIIEIAVLMAKKCSTQPRVIALVGNRDFTKEKLSSSLEKESEQLKSEGRLFEDKGAPFGELFKHMDCIIIHGGLGTTAEALRAGVPTMVTGVLLMDQRFWGRRCFELGVGPEPAHIGDFDKFCVENVDKALAPNSQWQINAKDIAEKIKGQTEDGVPESIEAIKKLLEAAVPIKVEAKK